MVERQMKKASGEWTWIEVRGKVIEYTQDNTPLLLTGVYINIDAKKRTEQLHLLAVAFETQEAILISDETETIIKVNEAFTRITGYTQEEILGKTPRVLKST
jgi:PAS domain-containing protein